MGRLDAIESPRDLRDLLVSTCARTGGHIGSNLGVVELTMAIHRVFDSPRDRVVFDTGHQTCVHKLLTGRRIGFDRLRSDASTALSYADGLAKAYGIRGEDRHVVAVIGDGALTGGMAWEALSNIAVARDSRLVIVVNDNGRSYTPTVGGLATALTALRTSPRYEQLLDLVKTRLNAVPGVGPAAYDALHGVKKGMKDVLAPQGLFEDLGLKCVGPVDGHDRAAMVQALAGPSASAGRSSCTRAPARASATTRPSGTRPTSSTAPAFRRAEGREAAQGEDLDRPRRRPRRRAGRAPTDVVAMTAAMMHPVGLDAFARRSPERTFDVGIAEQHAVTSAAG